jgi:hypothetical protein
MCTYTAVLYSCQPSHNVKKDWRCKAPRKRATTSLWGNCQQGTPRAVIQKREKCSECHSKWREDIRRHWAHSWRIIHQQIPAGEDRREAIRDEAADTETLWRLERKWHRKTMDPNRRTDVYKKLPEWTKAHLTAARTKYRGARSVLGLSRYLSWR